MLETGRYATIIEIARAEMINPSYVSRVPDDACRIEYAIDLTDSMVDGHIIDTLNAALRVLRKVHADA